MNKDWIGRFVRIKGRDNFTVLDLKTSEFDVNATTSLIRTGQVVDESDHYLILEIERQNMTDFEPKVELFFALKYEIMEMIALESNAQFILHVERKNRNLPKSKKSKKRS